MPSPLLSAAFSWLQTNSLSFSWRVEEGFPTSCSTHGYDSDRHVIENYLNLCHFFFGKSLRQSLNSHLQRNVSFQLLSRMWRYPHHDHHHLLPLVHRLCVTPLHFGFVGRRNRHAKHLARSHKSNVSFNQEGD